ncbi:MAG: hypothetical protein A2Z72_07690, partial [Omnitrophica bacterium RBG_13_46_9]
QLLALVGNQPLVEIAVERLIRSGIKPRNIYIQTLPQFKAKIFELVRKTGIRESQIFTEPQAADTAAAIGYASAKLANMGKSDIPTFIVTADHIIGEEAGAFKEAYLKAAAAVRESPLIGTIGIKPEGPSREYGHIKVGDESYVNGVYAVGEFEEKPEPPRDSELFEHSRQILAQGGYLGAYLFNSGMFIATPRTFLRAFQRLAPPYYEGLKRIMEAKPGREAAVERDVFKKFAEWKKLVAEWNDRQKREGKKLPPPNIKSDLVPEGYNLVGTSVDYVLAEPLGGKLRTPETLTTSDVGLFVTPGAFPWEDIGSFKSIVDHYKTHRTSDMDYHGNLVIKPYGVTVRYNNLVLNADGTEMEIKGLDDVGESDLCENCMIFIGEIPEEERDVRINLDLNGIKNAIVIYNLATKALLVAPMEVSGNQIRSINQEIKRKGSRWSHFLTGDRVNAPERTTIFRSQNGTDTLLFSTKTGRVISVDTNNSRLYSDQGLVAVIGMGNTCIMQHKDDKSNAIDIAVDVGTWRNDIKRKIEVFKQQHVERVRKIKSEERIKILTKEGLPSEFDTRTYANMFGMDIDGDLQTIRREIAEVQRIMRARDERERYFRGRFRPDKEEAKMGTSGVRGDSEKQLRDMEVFIHFKAQARHAKDLAKNPNFTPSPLTDFIRKGVLTLGDIIELAGDFRPSTPRILVAVAAAFIDEGFKIDFQGLVPTPELAYFTMEKDREARKEKKGRGGVMVTGSHNPYRQNGAKTYWGTGELLKPEESPLKPYVDQVRKEVYWQTEEESMFDNEGAFKKESELRSDRERKLLTEAKKAVLEDVKGPVDHSNLKNVKTVKGFNGVAMSESDQLFIERYTEAFGQPLKGKKAVFYAQSSVGRFVDPLILQALGAEVVYEEPAEDFVQIDTENFDKPLIEGKPGTIKDKLRELAKKHKADFVITTDGDSDRPVFADENGEILYGDKLGVLTSLYLGLDFVACPVSANARAVQLMVDRGIKVVLTNVGSPFVIEAMHKEGFKKGGRARRGGFEVNGGFLLGSDIRLPNGKTLKALPTRDATLPLICSMLYSIQEGKKASELIKDTFSGKYESYGFAGLVSGVEGEITAGCEEYTFEIGGRVKVKFSPAGLSEDYKDIAEIMFGADGTVRYTDIDTEAGGVVLDKTRAGEEAAKADARLTQYMLGAKDALTGYLRQIKGLEKVDIEKINYVDGIRIYLSNGEIAHLRPSGNAAQLRIYTEAETQKRAVEIVHEATKPNTGVLVKIIQDEIQASKKAKAEEQRTSRTPGTGAARTGADSGNQEALGRLSAQRAVLRLLASMGVEASLNEKTGQLEFSGCIDRGNKLAENMRSRNVLPEEAIISRERYETNRYQSVYSMTHVKGEKSVLHLATGFSQINPLYSGTITYQATGSHFQAGSLDFKYVRDGYGIQLIPVYDNTGSVVKVYAQYLTPGTFMFSLPGRGDIVVNLGGLLFSDRSFNVSSKLAGEIADQLGLSKQIMANEKWADELSASGMPYVFYMHNLQPHVALNPAYEGKAVPEITWIAPFKPEFNGIDLNKKLDIIFNANPEMIRQYEKELMPVIETDEFARYVIENTVG